MECTKRNAELLNSFSECVLKAFEAVKELEFQLSAEEIEHTIMENRLEYYRRFVTDNFRPVVSTREEGSNTDIDDKATLKLKTTGTSAISLENRPSAIIAESALMDQSIQCMMLSDGDLSAVDVVPRTKSSQVLKETTMHNMEEHIQTVLCSVANPNAVASDDTLLNEQRTSKSKKRTFTRRLRYWLSKRGKKKS